MNTWTMNNLSLIFNIHFFTLFAKKMLKLAEHIRRKLSLKVFYFSIMNENENQYQISMEYSTIQNSEYVFH